tara:strand:+ start:73458 stop:74225 length:768 start_codon:yes stop_codon:yes gene_type:complete
MTIIYFKNFSEAIIEITYSKGYSRPSRSLLTPELYNMFKCIKDTNILPNLSRENLIQECINYVYDTHTLFEENLLISDTHFKLIYSHAFADIIKEIKSNNRKNIAIIFTDIYNYPKIQFMYILNKYFSNVILSLSQFYNFGILFCENIISDNFLTINEEGNVKDFNVKIPKDILTSVKKYNDYIFKRIIDINEKLNDMCYSIHSVQILNTEIELLNKYYKLYISKQTFTICNNCKLIYSNFIDSCICEKCYALFT